MKKLLVILSLLAIPAVAANNTHNVRSKHTDADVQCLIDNMLHEARSEGAVGLTAVAYVTVNRVRSIAYPNSLCKVVWQKSQFSWTKHKMKPRSRMNQDVVELAHIIAYDVLFENPENRPVDPTKGSLWYHRIDVQPDWIPKKSEWGRKTMKYVITIKDHIFYAPKNRKQYYA